MTVLHAITLGCWLLGALVLLAGAARFQAPHLLALGCLYVTVFCLYVVLYS